MWVTLLDNRHKVATIVGMASMDSKFRAIQRENPNHSSLINFYRALKDQPLSFNRRVFYFRKLVSKEDYAKEDYVEIRNLYCEKEATVVKPYFDRKTSKTTINASPRNGAIHTPSFA